MCIVGPRCYIGPGASLRGDFGRIVLHAGSNVQDCCVLHSFPAEDTLLEEDAHIGHAAVLHGCTIRRGALIGIGAIVMDGAVVEEEAFVGAASFVRAGFVVPRAHARHGRAGAHRAGAEARGARLEGRPARASTRSSPCAAWRRCKECQPLAAPEANRAASWASPRPCRCTPWTRK